MYKPVDKDEVLRLVKQKGPVIPIHLRKDLNTDTVLIGAILSQLVAEGKIKVSRVKIGGSPTYYAVGDDAKLVDFMKHLNEKDRRAAEMLQEKKVLKDSEQDPLIRVCLRNIKDYAKELEVEIKGNKEVYWKWFLTSAEEAQEIISGKVNPKKIVPKEEPKPVKAPEVKKEEPVVEKKKEEKPVEVKKAKPVKEKSQKEERPALKPVEIQKTLAKPNLLLDQEKDDFFTQVRKFLEANDTGIIDYKIVKKGEIDLTIIVPTKLGAQEYFCKAKNKKKIAEGDLSSAYLQGQGTKLPIVFLSPGELNKKAKEMLSKEFKGMVVKQI
jgi:hypothetical protein